MSQITWGNVGERYFETGIDRGVLYVGDSPGVAWNGLISVVESAVGGEATPYYMDGIKYQNIASAEEFEATINAYFSPPEFDSCDGTIPLVEGLFATKQRRKSFGLSYRTKIGNDVEGAEHGYRIHLIYNALASPSEHSNATIGESVEAAELSWTITTTPVSINSLKPTAHLIIDSRSISNDLITVLERFLYGTESLESSLPSPDSLAALYNDFTELWVTLNGDGSYSINGYAVIDMGTGMFSVDDVSVNLIDVGRFEVGVDG